ncbi:MAG: DUF1329 domain-containing protein [Parvibaculum sp.]|uniref:DUF1329 domain-containing protein n=1 Tax=Parvibaculum sp. TaxID=2024848 RepID=UPI00284B1FFA|nr:DUF1329 domain-containing protein [Parvibaculum sp.]MDR3498971.1 DUF1329 domain-containing protein [Parvibaculum sp.]
MRAFKLVAAVAAWGVVASVANAGVPESQAARLGQDLTPLGAEKAGNADGSIPAWTGGLAKAPDGIGFKGDGYYPDPFAGDPVLFTVTKGNADKYADTLTPGQKAMLATYPDYKLNVYQSRRTCALPQAVYDATKKNARTGTLSGGGDSLSGVLMGIPYPLPFDAYEIVWNHNLRYRGYQLRRTFASAAPTREGSFTPIVVRDEAIFDYASPDVKSFEQLDNTSIRYIQQTLSPARRSGQLLLVHETVDPQKGERRSWQYTTGNTSSISRVQRTSAVAYDNPQIYSDAMSTADSFDVFSGPLDHYNWQVLGKEERYVAYNSYKLSAPTLKYTDVLKPGHLNQDLVRYEKHRVWAVEAVLKPTQRHVYHRRVAYFDEDGGNMVGGELYDARGGLWRVQEAQIIQYYDVPTCMNASDVVYDLTEGRYVAQNLKNQEVGINFHATDLKDSVFVPDELRRRVTNR